MAAFFCSVAECQRQTVARGMCRVHTRRPTSPPALALPSCIVPGCISDAEYAERRYCGTHQGARIGGRPIKAKAGWEPLQQFDLYVVRTATGCWQWTGSTQDGYGKVTNWDGGTLAHRFAYETRFGLIPDGMVIDHVCRNRACVNPDPDHLEAVTFEENVRRGAAPGRSLWVPPVHCARGHEFTDDNTYRPPGSPHRHCRECRRLTTRERRKRATTPR